MRKKNIVKILLIEIYCCIYYGSGYLSVLGKWYALILLRTSWDSFVYVYRPLLYHRELYNFLFDMKKYGECYKLFFFIKIYVKLFIDFNTRSRSELESFLYRLKEHRSFKLPYIFCELNNEKRTTVNNIPLSISLKICIWNTTLVNLSRIV